MKNQIISLQLNQFEGSLDLLVHLVNQKEVEIQHIVLKEIFLQTIEFILKTKHTNEVALSLGTDAMGYMGHLLWMKSRSLFPEDEGTPFLQEEDLSELKTPLFEDLIEYCLFKDAAKYLSSKEEKAYGTFGRNLAAFQVAIPTGVEHISISELSSLFQQVLQKSKDHIGIINEEICRVSDQITWLKNVLSSRMQIPFDEIFTTNSTKLELIVIFLAVLEMMKAQELKVVKQEGVIYIRPFA